jgi:hypothetical protein
MNYAVSNNLKSIFFPELQPENEFLSHITSQGDVVLAANNPEVDFGGRVQANIYRGVLDQELAETVFKFATAFMPETDNVLNWNGPKNNLGQTFYEFIFTDSSSPESLANQQGVGANTDAVTALLKDNNGNLFIKTEIFADRIYFDSNGQRRSDADILANLVMASVHEIYGNTTGYLNAIQNGQDLSNLDRRAMEIAAFQAAIDYVNRMKASPQWNNFSPELKTAFDQALQREQEGLESWKSAPSQ